jgi:hypothetical protein
MFRTSSRRAAAAAAGVLLVGSVLTLVPGTAGAATVGTLTIASEVNDNVWNNQNDTFRFATSTGCPAPATNFQVRIYGTTTAGANVFTPAPPSVNNVDTNGDGTPDNFAPNIQGNTSQSTVGGNIQAGSFSGPVALTLAGFATAQAQPGGYLPAGTYGMQLVCRTAGNSTSLGEFVLTFTVTGSGASSVVEAQSPPPTADVTTTVLTTTPAGSAVVGSSVTLTATVSNSTTPATVPTGTVQFTSGAANVGSPVALVAGVAALPTTVLPVGAQTLAAQYIPGSAAFSASTSSGVAFTVNPYVTTTTLTTSPASPVVGGASVTLTATVSNSSVPATVPTGTVQFSVDGAPFGSPVAVAGGVAALSTTGLPVGSLTLGAAFVPATTSFAASTAATVPFVVEVVVPDATKVVVTTDPAGTVQAGTPVQLTATVSNLDDSTTPSGTVQFTLGGVDFGTPVALNGSGVATTTNSALPVGSAVIGARYIPGSPAFIESTADTVTLSVVAYATSTTLVVSPDTSTSAGSSVTLTATVANLDTAAVPTGTVQFKANGADVGAPAAVNGSGVATLTTTTLPAGSLTLAATYLPATSGFVGSTSTGVPIEVLTFATSTTVTTSPVGSAPAGSSVTLSATVANTTAPGTVPMGSVQFKLNGSALGAPQPLDGSGVATLTTTSLPAGNQNLAATFVPSSTAFVESTSTGVSFQVLTYTTTTTLVSAPAGPVAAGSSVTLTATVANTTAPGTTPTGSVQFKNGTTNLGSPVAVSGAGTAAFTTTALPVGTASLTAQFIPSGAAFLASTSAAVGLVVNPYATTTTLAVSPASAVTGGDSVTLTATVATTPAGGPAPAGSVQFEVNGEDFGQPVPLNGSAVAALTTTGLQAGALSLSATYVPSSTTFTGSSATTVPFVVQTFETTLELEVAPSGSVTQGDPVTLTATVTSAETPVDVASAAVVGRVRAQAAGVPVGGVQFTVNGSPLGAPVPVDEAGTATLTVTDLPAGTLSFGASFTPGSSGFVASTASSTVTLIVEAAPSSSPTSDPTDLPDSGGTGTGGGDSSGGLASTGVRSGIALAGALALGAGLLLVLGSRRPAPVGRHSAGTGRSGRR